ncbi:hypothetical protein QCA50_001562 [Cerrena zonata]|uniref:Uncharacterized protein n=1 Tax=Cerrena zonata TaxID=2478898 RepID=A0AAW0GNM9_9APHY
MSAVYSAFANFIQALGGIVGGIMNSVLAIFQAFLALVKALLSGVFQVGQAILKLGADLTQDVVGFVFANFFLILVLGGGYYLYSTRQGARTSIKKRV